MDQPLADPSCIALYFVSKIASEHVKVVLSGEGADELFGGYDVYNEPLVFKKLSQTATRIAYLVKKIPPKNLKKQFKGQSFVTRGELPTNEYFIGNANMFSYEDKLKLLKTKTVLLVLRV